MNYTIENLDKMRLVGLKTKIESQSNKMTIIQNFWKDNFQNGCIPSLLAENNATHNKLLGVSHNMKEDGSFDYYIALESDKPLKAGFYELDIKASKYVVVKGPNSDIGNMFNELLSNIIPNNEYNADDLSIEFYKVDGECEVYLAIK